MGDVTLDAQGVIDQKRTAMALQWLSAGRHRVDITAEGYEPAVRMVDIRPGQTAVLSVDLARKPAPEATLPAARAAPPIAASSRANATAQPPRSDETLAPTAIKTAPAKEHPAAGLPASVWISGGATFGLGVIAVVTGQLALAANREYDTNLAALRNSALTEYQRAGAWARGVDAADHADALAAVTDILLTFTLVGVGLTTYFYLADRDASERQRLRVGLRSDARSGRLELRGSF